MLAKHGPFAWLTINFSYGISTGIHKRISNYGIATLLEVIAQDDGITNGKSLYLGHRFPAVVISCAVRWYYRIQLSLRGESWLRWRAVDEHGAELDILLQKRRDTAAAKRFFQRVLRS